MQISRKKSIKRELLAMYDSLYPSQQEVKGINTLFTFFQGPMTTTRLVMYVISVFAFTTGAYAAVAPQSFARVATSVQTSIGAVIDTSLEAVGLKAKSDIQADAFTDTETNIGIDASEKLDSNHDVSGEDGNSLNKINGHIETDTQAKLNGEAQVELGVDSTTKYIKSTIHGTLLNADIDAQGRLDADGSTLHDEGNKIEVDSTINSEIDMLQHTKEDKEDAVMELNSETSVKSSANTSVGTSTAGEQEEIKVDNVLESTLGVGL